MKPKKTLKIGRSNFELMIKGNHYFVDKTALISEFYNNQSDVILMPRPKRFGKSLNLSMIDYFFNIQKPQSKELFTEFEIAKDKAFCEKHQNKYPVINITLKDIKADNWNDCYGSFTNIINELYSDNIYLLKSNKLDDYDKSYIENIISNQADYSQYKFSLQRLSSYLHKHFNKKVIILVDEYDTPIINAFNYTNPPIKSTDKENKTYYEKVIGFMQTFLGKAYKDNIYLEKGLLTGVMRVGKESIFSEWNNIKVYDITSNYFSDKFGFTQKEIEDLLDYFNVGDQLPEVEKWYNGYKFGKTDKIYNPWSIMNYLSNIEDGFQAYWVNSSDYSLIQNHIENLSVNKVIETLIEGKTIQKVIKNNFIFEQFDNNIELLWTLLFHSGFLTQIKHIRRGMYELRIPNNEVKIGFLDIILELVQNKYNIKESLLAKTFNYLSNNDLIKFEMGLKEIMQDSLSYFDTAHQSDNDNTKIKEQIFHVYTLGLLSILSNDYIIKSNRESGEGRYDIMLIPYDKNRHGIVIEFKSIPAQRSKETDKKFAERINKTRNTALRQIEINKYYKELIDNKIESEKIIKLPIIFAGKEPFVNQLTINKP